jgi:muramidase (phage lysozyme)
MLKTTSPGLNSFKSTIPSFGVVRRAYGTSPKEYSDAIIDRYGDPLADIYNKSKKEKAIGFISGGKPLGSSVSANNIVGFTRNIRPRPNNLQSIISNLSSSIFNTTDNKNITSNIKETIVEKRNQITNVVKKLISNYKNIFPLNQNQKEVVKKQEGIKPFGGFFDNLKKAASFIAFFGSKKNLDRIAKNIQNLKDTFIKTFDIAKLLRKAIKKIFKQLSDIKPGGGRGILDNIFSAISGFISGLLGGLIPGGNKDNRSGRQGQIPQRGRQTSGMKIPRFPGGKVGKLIAGAGLATGAGAAISGLSQPGQTEEIEPTETTLEAPGSVLDKFNSVLDRFDRILDGMLKGKKSDKSTSPSSPASSGGEKSSGSSGFGGGGGISVGEMTPASVGTPEQKALLDAISYAEGTTGSYGTIFGGKVVPELESGELTVREVYDMMNTGQLRGRNIEYGSGSRATGRYQFMPDTLSDIVKTGAISWDEKFTPEAQDRAILARLSFFRGVIPELLKKEGLSQRVSSMIAPEIASFPTSSGGSYYSNQSVKRLQDIQNVYNQRLNQGPQSVQVQPYQPNPQSPSAGPSQQTQPQVTVVPIGGQAPQVQTTRPGTGIIAPPPPKQNGPTAPFLPSANSNNFLTLYSRMVYNIVDG